MTCMKLNAGSKYQFYMHFYDKKIYVLCIMVSFCLIMTYTLKKTADNTFVPDFTTLFSRRQRLENESSPYYSISMPCIEPHCNIECSVMYKTYEKDGIIRSKSLTKIQQQHLMIDIGDDAIVQELIHFIPPYKVCPGRQQLDLSSNRTTNTTVKLYPILFGFVDQYLPRTTSRQVFINNQLRTVDQICLPKKTMNFSDLIPGRMETYKFGFENELDYRRLYSTAYFAITKKKAGWDCNRHYEIISSGTIPFFDNLNQAGSHTLSLLPKSLLYAAQAIPGVNRQNLSIDHNLFDVNQYNLLLHRLLYYAKHRLTTEKIVEYILTVIKYSPTSSKNHSVLYIAHDHPDYMKDFMLHGFTQIFEENLHVFQPPHFIYDYPLSKIWNAEQTTNYFKHRLYGLGYGYKLTLKNYVHLFERDKKDLSSQNIVENNIKNKTYSLIVFGSIHRANSLFSLVKEHYEQSRIVIIDGEDQGKYTQRLDYAKWGTFFLREIPDDCNAIM